jgi:ribosome biogenesis GTPase
MKALVTKSTGAWYTLLSGQGLELRGRVRGKLRQEGFKSTNPIAVGDVVSVEPESEPDLVIIREISPRRNYIIRKSNNLSRQSQIIAANLDLALLIVTLAEPATSLGFIDRFLLTAEAYHIPALIAFNKTDIYQKSSLSLLEKYEKIYLDAGYECLRISAKQGHNLNLLREKISGKTTLLCGHSGVGKSTLLNSLKPGTGQKTGNISEYSLKGKHTTTFAEMFHLDETTKIIDTPGIKDFGVVDIKREELSHYFREMKAYIGQCRFNNCIHLEEPGCAIKEAVEAGRISPLRYGSYLGIMSNEDAHH